jgi:predicted dithiol-disulfide oxidoreductase (DUF899 family)
MMASHTLGTHEEWRAARLELLEAEKERRLARLVGRATRHERVRP